MKIFTTLDSRKRRVIYQYDEEGLFLLSVEDFTNHVLLQRTDCDHVFNFPLEIYQEIMKEVFCLRLSTRNLDLLYELALINQFTARFIYNQFYGLENETPEEITIVEMLKRIRYTCDLLVNLHDDYIIEERQYSNRVGIRLHPHHAFTTLSGDQQPFIPYTGSIDPWNFCSNFQLVGIERANTRNTFSAIYGEHYGDTIYVDGKNRQGMYCCTRYEQPVFVFLLVDAVRVWPRSVTAEQMYVLIPTSETIQQTHTLGCLADMLKIMYGPQTGVYFMVKDDENHITSHNERYVQLLD